ncbi:hypothetical protein HK104_010765 [Borealophlyctis nickersoniae]|nr:hypothetical protein HK104_010765 [Borealophlyctis nickersoniae]
MQDYLRQRAPNRSPTTDTPSSRPKAADAKTTLAYDLQGLDDTEKIAKLAELLDAKEEEISRLKRRLAQIQYDSAWNRARQGPTLGFLGSDQGWSPSSTLGEQNASPEAPPSSSSSSHSPSVAPEPADTAAAASRPRKGCPSSRIPDPIKPSSVSSECKENTRPVPGIVKVNARALVDKLRHKIHDLQKELAETRSQAEDGAKLRDEQIQTLQELVEAKTLRLRAEERMGQQSSSSSPVMVNKSETDTPTLPASDTPSQTASSSSSKPPVPLLPPPVSSPAVRLTYLDNAINYLQTCLPQQNNDHAHATHTRSELRRALGALSRAKSDLAKTQDRMVKAEEAVRAREERLAELDLIIEGKELEVGGRDGTKPDDTT